MGEDEFDVRRVTYLEFVPKGPPLDLSGASPRVVPLDPQAAQLSRIADALERIAAAVERKT